METLLAITLLTVRKPVQFLFFEQTRAKQIYFAGIVSIWKQGGDYWLEKRKTRSFFKFVHAFLAKEGN